ncbi:MAG: OmpH family outer membrane protein [Victivallales bacterium]|nr:OmpH family outer membrane protein [Victivallales bacterium]
MMKQIAVLLALCACVAAFAQERFAYVNMETVFNEYYKTVNENINIENLRKQYMDGFNLLRDEFQASLAEYQKALADADNELLSDEVRENARNKAQLLEGRLQQKQEEIMRYRQDGLGEIEERQQLIVEKLAQELTEQVRKYAEVQGYTTVLEVSGKSLNRVPMVIAYPKEQEITDAIVKLVNAGHEAEKAEAEAKLTDLRNKLRAAQEAAAQQN